MILKEVANENELEGLLLLLKSVKLPVDDIRLDNNLFIMYHDERGELMGSGGLEFYSNYALLRSVAVLESARGKAVGKCIVNDMIDKARSKSLNSIYLLTETAHDFFIKLGFKDVSRESVPIEVKASSEFTSVCPVSASCMVYSL